MAKNKNPNPKANPIIQALLDLQKAGMQMDGFIEEVNKHPDILAAATQLNKTHRYPNRRIDFVQETNIRENHKAILSLSQQDKTAVLVFETMAKIIRQDNNIQFSIDDCMRILNMSKPTAIKAMKTLQENGFIRIVLKPAGQRPAVYNLNPELVWVGNPAIRDIAIKEFYEAIGDERHFAFASLNKQNEYETVSEVKVPLENGKVIRATEIRYIKKESSNNSDSEDSNTITDGDNVPF